MKAPFVRVVLYFCLGILAASQLRFSVGTAITVAGGCCVLSIWLISRKWLGEMTVAMAVFASGAACLANYDTLPLDHVRYLIPKYIGQQCEVTGRVVGESEIINGRTTFILQSRRMVCNSYSNVCSGSVLAAINGSIALEPGQEVLASGELRLPLGWNAERRFNRRDYWVQRGIYAMLRVPSPQRLKIVSICKWPGIGALSLRMKKRLLQKIRYFLSPVAASVLEAMLLGEKQNIPRSVYSDMIKSGTVHILVVSGFNVGIVAGILALVLKILCLHRILRLVIIVPALVFYCVMTGISPPVARATIMGILFFVSWYVRRDPDIFQALSFSAFVILAVNPRQLYSASFQLSFMAVLAICFLAPRIEKRILVDKIRVRVLRWIAGLTVVSVSAWLGTGGFIIYYFRIFAPITVIANIFIPALASLITLCGVALVTGAFICPYVAYTFASLCEFLIVLLLQFNGFLIQIPGAYFRLP
jgi:competence protein ComEC